MTRDELINKIITCLDCELCSKCEYYTSCDGYDVLLDEFLEYLEGELDADIEETNRLIERIKKARNGGKE